MQTMPDLPLISCIMPTCNRRLFAQQSIKYFDAQTYPRKELIIVDDGYDKVHDLLGNRQDIRYLYCTHKMTIGEKINHACALALGDFVCRWNDDDYFGPERLALQAEPLLTGRTDISGMKLSWLFDLRKYVLWLRSTGHDDEGIHASTLLFRATYWRDGLHYEHWNTGADEHYLGTLLACGARPGHVYSSDGYIYVRHYGNVSANGLMYSREPGLKRVAIAEHLSAEDRQFYRRARVK